MSNANKRHWLWRVRLAQVSCIIHTIRFHGCNALRMATFVFSYVGATLLSILRVLLAFNQLSSIFFGPFPTHACFCPPLTKESAPKKAGVM